MQSKQGIYIRVEPKINKANKHGAYIRVEDILAQSPTKILKIYAVTVLALVKTRQSTMAKLEAKMVSLCASVNCSGSTTVGEKLIFLHAPTQHQNIINNKVGKLVNQLLEQWLFIIVI